MSDRTATLAFSPALLLAQWCSRYKGYLPQERRDGVTQDIVWAGAYVDLVVDRWVYVLTETQSGSYDVPYELFVDAKGQTWVNQSRIFDPLKKRKDPVRSGGLAIGGFAFPRVDVSGRALWVRLLSSSFRLPSAMTRSLLAEEVRAPIRKHVTPLWTWWTKNPEPGLAVLRSADGLWLKETPLVVTVPSSSPYADGGPVQRVAPACNPFAIAENLSEMFLKRYQEFTDRFAPEDPPAGGEFQKMAFCSVLDSAFGRTTEGMGRTQDFLDWPRIRRAQDDYEKKIKDGVKHYEERAVAMCQVLESPLFELYAEAALDDEGFVGDDESPAWEAYRDVMGMVHRNIEASVAGQGLMARWSRASIERPDHPVSRGFWPAVNPTKQHFKMFRWGAKASMGVWAKQVGYRVDLLKKGALGDLLETVLLPIARVHASWNDSFRDLLEGRVKPSQIKSITQVPLCEDKLIDGSYLYFTREWGAASREPRKGVMTVVFNPEKHQASLQAWYDADKSPKYGKYDAVLSDGTSFRTVNAVVLDSINLALALMAVLDAKNELSKRRTDVEDAAKIAAAHSVNLTLSLLEWMVNANVISKASKAGKVINGLLPPLLRIGTGLVFRRQNLRDSELAQSIGDDDRAFALKVAAGGEVLAPVFAALSKAMITTAWGTTLGLAGAVITLITAGAYIAAIFLKDDEILDQFLQTCEWGLKPYQSVSAHPLWTTMPVQTWENDFPAQQRLLIHLIHRFEVSWVRFEQELLGLDVKFAALTPTSQLQVRYRAEFVDRSVQESTVVYSRAELPDRAPASLSIPMSPGIGTYGLPLSLTAAFTFRICDDLEPYTFEFRMKDNGNYLSKLPRLNLVDEYGTT